MHVSLSYGPVYIVLRFFQGQPSQAQWNGGYYGYPQGYDAYGYAAAPQDPNMYYANYAAGYGNYQQTQQVTLLAFLCSCVLFLDSFSYSFPPLSLSLIYAACLIGPLQ